jgi:hypothetical protein
MMAAYTAGQSWYEAPGCSPRISHNASTTEKAVLHATFIIKTEGLEKEGLGVLVQVKPEYLEGAMEQMQRKDLSIVSMNEAARFRIQLLNLEHTAFSMDQSASTNS